MDEFAGIFEVLASDETDIRLAKRKSVVLAETRVTKSLGSFLSSSRSQREFDERYALVKDDFVGIVQGACEEVGNDEWGPVLGTLHAHFRLAADSCKCGKSDCKCSGKDCDCKGGCNCRRCSSTRNADTKPGEGLGHDKDDDEAEPSKPWEDDDDDHGPADSDEGDSESDHAWTDLQRSESSVHEARRPKMCPYHSEIVDISLASDNPQAGYESMSGHAWGDKHCQGSWDGGSCKFKREMVTKTYWDDRQKNLDDKRDQRAEQGQENVLDIPEDEIGSTEPEATTDGFNDSEPQGEVIDVDFGGGSDSESVADAPAVEAPLAVAAKTVTAREEVCPRCGGDGDVEDSKGESSDCPTCKGSGKVHNSAVRWSQTTVLAEAGNTDLGGPSPKMKKERWTPKSVTKEQVEEPSKRHPTKRKDAIEPIKAENDGPPGSGDALKEIGEQTTEQEKLPSDKENAGFSGGGVDKGPKTKTFPNGNQTKPVTSKPPEE